MNIHLIFTSLFDHYQPCSSSCWPRSEDLTLGCLFISPSTTEVDNQPNCRTVLSSESMIVICYALVASSQTNQNCSAWTSAAFKNILLFQECLFSFLFLWTHSKEWLRIDKYIGCGWCDCPRLGDKGRTNSFACSHHTKQTPRIGFAMVMSGCLFARAVRVCNC